MAASTWTYTANMATPAMAPHTGVQAISFKLLAENFGSASDVALLGRLPDGITILGGSISGIVPCDKAIFALTARNYLDTSKTGGTIRAAVTFCSTVQTFDIIEPTRISLSADTTTSEAILYLMCTTAGTVTDTVSLYGTVYYTNDGRNFGL